MELINMKRSKLFDSVASHTTDGVLVVSMDGTVLSANHRATKILGFAEETLIGQSYSWIFFHETQNQELSQIINDGLKKDLEHQAREIGYQSPIGNTITLQISTALLNEKDLLGMLTSKKSLVVFLRRMATKGEASEAESLWQEEKELLEQQLESAQQEQEELSELLPKSERAKLAAGGAIFFLFLLAILYSTNSIKILRADAVPKESKKIESQVVMAKLDTLSMQINLSGTIEPFSKVTIAAQTSGKVVHKNFNQGDFVPKGHILYQLDTKELAKNVRTARVTYMELLEKYDQLKDWESSLEVNQAKRSFELSKIAMNNEKRKLQETQKLFEKGIIPRVEYEQTQTSYKRAEYDFENAKQSLETTLDKGSSEKIEVLRLKLSNAKEELDEIEARYEATLIRAPLAGIVMLPESSDGRQGSFKKEGDMVNDADLIATIGATESYIMDTAVGELSLKYLQVGQSVEVSGPSFGGSVLSAKVDRIAATATEDGNARFYPVRISIPSASDSTHRKIHFGVIADARIHIRNLIGVVAVPIEAVSRSKGKDVVHVKKGEDEQETKPVKVGYSDGSRIEIVSGLEAGEQIWINSIR